MYIYIQWMYIYISQRCLYRRVPSGTTCGGLAGWKRRCRWVHCGAVAHPSRLYEGRLQQVCEEARPALPRPQRQAQQRHRRDVQGALHRHLHAGWICQTLSLQTCHKHATQAVADDSLGFGRPWHPDWHQSTFQHPQHSQGASMMGWVRWKTLPRLQHQPVPSLQCTASNPCNYLRPAQRTVSWPC